MLRSIVCLSIELYPLSLSLFSVVFCRNVSSSVKKGGESKTACETDKKGDRRRRMGMQLTVSIKRERQRDFPRLSRNSPVSLSAIITANFWVRYRNDGNVRENPSTIRRRVLPSCVGERERCQCCAISLKLCWSWNDKQWQMEGKHQRLKWNGISFLRQVVV